MKSNDEPKVVSIQVPDEVVRDKMKESRDFRMKITQSGDLNADCKTCETPIFIDRDEMLIWFHCKSCNRYSFDPPQNVQRKAAFAIQDGRPFEYEGFFIEFPPELKPPAVFDSVTLNITKP